MRVNHVLSTDQVSPFFSDLLGYFKLYSEPCVQHVASLRPLPDYDVYHYHRPHLEQRLHQPSIVTVHHDIRDTDDWLTFEKFLPRYREADRIICLNQTQQRLLSDSALQDTVVIPHGYNARFLSKKPLRRFDANRQLVLGLLSKRYARRAKGEAYLLELLKRLDSARFRFILVGEGRFQEAELLRRFGFCVAVFERLPYRLFNAVYEQLDFLLIVSNFEGGPANLPEALATATPIITTRVGMAEDLVIEGENGSFLSQDADADTLLLHRLAANDRDVTNRLFAGAYKRSGHALPWEDIISRYLQIYQDVVQHAAN